MARLQNFLSRNGYPCVVLDVATDEEARALVERTGVQPEELPVLVCPNGTVLKRPSDAEAGMCLGITPEIDTNVLHDVIVVGAGPAGLATAVYAASEGLSVLVLDHRSFGGQAGASARIENYLGFPTGISGCALAGRAFSQAQKFGAEVAIPLEVAHLDCGGPARRPHEPLRLELADGRSVRGRTVVVASGARYRQPNIPNVTDFEGAGVSYWASAVEAKLCEGEEIALVGGGNSAGQAVVFLAPKVKHVHLAVRRPLEATMSRYLIDRIAALPNVSIYTGAEVIGLEGDQDGRAVQRDLPRPRFRKYPHLSAAAPVPVHRRRSERRLARQACGGGQQGLRHHRRWTSRRRTCRSDARRCRLKPASLACSRSATFARARPSGSPQRSARVPRSLRRSTRRSRTPNRVFGPCRSAIRSPAGLNDSLTRIANTTSTCIL